MLKTKFYTVYQITNLINNYTYIGVHETYNINDKYMGSGKEIKKVIKKFGKLNFKKEILFIFDNKKDMLDKERELVNEDFIKRSDTYNIILGGSFHTGGLANVKDSEGNAFLVDINDQRYLSGELVGVAKGFINVRNEEGNIYRVDTETFLNSNLTGLIKGKVLVNNNGNGLLVDKDDDRYLSGELKPFSSNKIICKDNNGIIFCLDKDSDEWKSGDYKFLWKGLKHKPETIELMKKSRKGKGLSEKNSQYNTCWIYNLEMKVNKKIKKEDLDYYLNNKWVLGRNYSFNR